MTECNLVTKGGDAILSPNGKTRVFQRNDLMKDEGANEHTEDRLHIEESELS